MAKRSRTIESSSEDDVSLVENYSDSVSELENGAGDEIEEDEDDEDEDKDDEIEEQNEDEEEEDEDDDDEITTQVDGDDADQDIESSEHSDEDDDFSDKDTSKVDLSRMTARQRNKRYGISANIGLINLAELEGTRPKKVQLSAEEQRIKRAEMARRRRNQSAQRLEEEKKETLDKLLKKRAKKIRGNLEEASGEPSKLSKSRLRSQHPAFTNWRSTSTQFLLSVTEERANLDFPR